jgi:hypothetical protein
VEFLSRLFIDSSLATMEAITVYQTSSVDFQQMIKEEAGKELDSFLNKFNNVFVSPEDVALFHGVSKQTVYNHIKYGTLIPESREKDNGSIYFRLNDALRIDFKRLRKLKT